MKRVPEVIDCWFDSGAMPYAELHYPFENKELFEKRFPADFISEAVDQTRGWFYALHAESTLLFDSPAFRNVIVMGLVQDENGEKMSKSKGNTVDPMKVLSEYGADAVRWYFYTSSAPWLPKRFSDKLVQEGQRKFLGTLWNTYAFYTLYADIDSFDPSKYVLDRKSLSVMDRWILSKTHSMIRDVDRDLAEYKITEAADVLETFVDDLSNWYVRRGRERYWGKGMEEDKVNAFMTLYTALKAVTLVSAPFIPFMTEQIYQNVIRPVEKDAPESVHLADYPAFDESMIDEALEKEMDLVLKLVVMGRAARNAAAIKNRQPLKKMFVRAPFVVSERCHDIITDELNVKEIEFTDDVSSFTTYTFKPQLRTVGPKYGKMLGSIRNALSALDGNAAMNELKANGRIVLTMAEGTAELTEEDLLIEMTEQPGYVTESDQLVTVVLDTNLDAGLIDEGYVREIISKVQTMRKEADFVVTDHIRITFESAGSLARIFREYGEEIKKETLGESIENVSPKGYVKEWDVNGEECRIGVERV
ncbi:MAG: class I tRNA ligase family protein, partial [Lachnospiraceae bacterium]|nr:class I tRNA ligase family protein [Lachnospiraceae bacterium]